MTKGPQPKDIAKAGSEHAHQVALFAWAALEANRLPELRLMFAIPNGGLRNVITASNLKAEGVKPGVPDILLPVPRGRWHGLFLELKAGANKPSKEQLRWIEDLRSQSYGACVCVGWELARDVILSYLNSS